MPRRGTLVFLRISIFFDELSKNVLSSIILYQVRIGL